MKGSSKQFKATINYNINDEAGIAMFIENYNAKNGETLCVVSAFRKTKFKSVKYFRCHHNTRYRFYIYFFLRYFYDFNFYIQLNFTTLSFDFAPGGYFTLEWRGGTSTMSEILNLGDWRFQKHTLTPHPYTSNFSPFYAKSKTNIGF